MSKTVADPKLVEKAMAIAAEKAIEYLEKERHRQNKNKRDRRLRNTKLLLRNYRRFKVHCEDNIQELEQLQDPDSIEYLDTDELAIESIIRNKKRTAVMLAYIDRMIHVYRILSEQSQKAESIRQFQALYDYYISDDAKTIDDIVQGTFVTKRTVYKDINKACEALSSLIFGVDGIRIID